MKVTELAPGMFNIQHGTAQEDAAIIAMARALVAERGPESLDTFEQGMRLQYGSAAMERLTDVKVHQ